MKFFSLSLVVLLVFLGAGCSSKSDTWQGFYYPNGCLSCDDDYVYSPVFQDRLSCFNWAYDYQNTKGSPNDLWECGKNCEIGEYGMNVCEETVD